MEEINDPKHNQNKLELMERYLRQQRGSLDEMQRLGLEQGPEPTIVSLDTAQSVSSEECHSLSDYSSQARIRSDWSDSSYYFHNPSAIENLTYLSKRDHSSSLELFSDDELGSFPRIEDFEPNQYSIEGHETVNYHLKHRINSNPENEPIHEVNSGSTRKVRRLRKSINFDSCQYKPPPSKVWPLD
ncbi:hypothetical protein CONCODRAFT_82847 [Conidiobolus coronatus NRRL 28638]|uniref:Uncharacterized protein n=1 Tax=Conidiobolus coronatus (strain ATCC 28846 / CBS 209.66 / NRRL 28638) TaxID=796925 RepID=A0A137PHX4_CONC2|nr:hypothetical protein CONCODRAFT_82847 [Conidiobolus coronatus NRRL 28638]|eukprot:KXN74541.1 hypothetical protein CONCODRAFT_82847 [Conidiobolus coronatus NRRL 28638]